MVSNRRRAPADSEMRGKLIVAAEEIICEHGHGALTSRTLADKLSLKRQIVHYYFESMDELLVQIVRSCRQRTAEALLGAEAAGNPLAAIWSMSRDPKFAILSLELAALAARHTAVREEVRQGAEEQRVLQTRILTDYLAEHGLHPSIDPELVVMVISSLSQTMVQEEAIGISGGHEKMHRAVEQMIREFGGTGAISI